MTKKLFLMLLMLSAVFITPAASDTDFDKAEMRRALDLINQADEQPFWSKLYAKNIENRFKAWFMFSTVTGRCNEIQHKIAEAMSEKKHEEIKNHCDKQLEWLNDLVIRPLKDLNTPESNELAEILARKAQYHRSVLNIQKIIPKKRTYIKE